MAPSPPDNQKEEADPRGQRSLSLPQDRRPSRLHTRRRQPRVDSGYSTSAAKCALAHLTRQCLPAFDTTIPPEPARQRETPVTRMWIADAAVHRRTPIRVCPGCGLGLPYGDGLAHPYIGASPECWAIFGALRAEGLGPVGDAYAVQHPGLPERRAIQSVGTHLIWLCLLLERSARPDRHATTLRRILAQPPSFVWLSPPAPDAFLTVLDVAERRASPCEYTEAVWRAWAPHHDQVRAWADAADLGGSAPR